MEFNPQNKDNQLKLYLNKSSEEKSTNFLSLSTNPSSSKNSTTTDISNKDCDIDNI